MKYNTQQPHLRLPEYGRYIQRMVDHAVTIGDRAERQRCAESIIAVMKRMFPEQQDMPDYQQKLWDHLAIMADFKLDIDYPFEVIRPESVHAHPDRVPYAAGGIRYRHYGRYITDMIAEACSMPEGEERDELVKYIAIQMKKEMLLWNKEGVETGRISNDMAELSDGLLHVDEEAIRLADYKMPAVPAAQAQQGQGKKKKKKKKQQSQY